VVDDALLYYPQIKNKTTGFSDHSCLELFRTEGQL
jgi:hypothetical protein